MVTNPLTLIVSVVVLAASLRLAWWLRRRRKRRVYTASDAFLRSPEWRRVRYVALKANDGRCEACGRNKHQLPPGEYLNVDHITPRRTHPERALDIRNLQTLCSSYNHGKGNRDVTDWRHRNHPHCR